MSNPSPRSQLASMINCLFGYEGGRGEEPVEEGGWRTQEINFASSQLTLSFIINHSFGLEKAGSSCDGRRRDKKMAELIYGAPSA
jgi:hypothetical protein